MRTASLPHLTLPSIIQAAPALLGILSPKSWAALSNCSRQLRAQIHSTTRIVTLDDIAELSTVMDGDWPLLSVIVLRNTSMTTMLPQQQPRFLAALESFDFMEVSNTLLLIKRRPGQDQFSTQSQHLTRALLHLRQPEYTALTRLYLNDSSLSADGIALLATSNLPELHLLDLGNNSLTAGGVACLVKGAWAKLHYLHLEQCNLDTAAMAHLVQGKWPELEGLGLSANPRLGAAAMLLLSSADWPVVNSVEMRCTMLTAATVSSFAHSCASWGHLSYLDLRWAGLNAAAMSELARGNLLNLGILDVSGNELEADAIAALVSAELPNLTGLYLGENNLNATAAKHLSEGFWPDLEFLDLSDNRLDSAAMHYLARGEWSYLESLNLFTNCLDAHGLRILTEGQWPYLKCLYLDASLGGVSIFDALTLHPDFMSSFDARLKQTGRVSVARYYADMSSSEDLSKQSWLKLQQVVFGNDKTTRTIDGTRTTHAYDRKDSV